MVGQNKMNSARQEQQEKRDRVGAARWEVLRDWRGETGVARDKVPQIQTSAS